ncbi:MAG: hypothetical protein HY702_00715 [Gemmatimonadetes bacterium]|nr:hypothetical protein [Gemmatimonadota bacterium]
MDKESILETRKDSVAGSVWPSVAGLFSGIAASLCCILPVLAAFAGIGSAALAGAVRVYRPWLIGLTVIVLGFGYYDAFLRRRAVVCEHGTCRLPGRVKTQRVLLVVATVIAGAAIGFEWWGPYVLG